MNSVAKERGWFKTYTPFTSRVSSVPFFGNGHDLPVLGICTVEIPTKSSPHASVSASNRSIVIHDVLHVPDSLCNFIGNPVMFANNYHVMTGVSTPKSKGVLRDSQGRNVAFFLPKSPLLAVKLRRTPDGPRYGRHTLENDGTMYMLGCRWAPQEQRKWEQFKSEQVSFASKPGPTSCTDAEKAYPMKHYRSEYHFLLQHGLRIHNDEDRDDGRAILRALMQQDENSDESDDADEFAEYEGHQADYHFTEPQLEWIEKHYRNSEQFMITYGLKFYDDEDLEEAKAIVDAMMDDDE